MNDLNSYLVNISNRLILGVEEKIKIESSIDLLKQKIWGVFQDRLANVILIGSYDRGTFINIEQEADIDLLTVFKQNQFQPKTYLSQLKSFGEKVYPRSEIYSDHPTVVIELNHIKFELVPAFPLTSDSFKIPAAPSKEISWITTSPKTFKEKLLLKDKNNKNLILPTIRLAKYWNLINGKLFNSYLIEKGIIEREFTCKNLIDYFLESCLIFTSIAKSEQEKRKSTELLEVRRRIKLLDREKFPEYSILEMQKLLPIIKRYD
jgi:hypothetical protein